MGGDLIQAQYEQLDAIAARFGQQAHLQAALQNQIKRSLQPLQQGGWQGKGSVAFFAEMNGKILPAMQRLAQALEQAQAVTLEISQILQAAEREAAAPFKGRGKLLDLHEQPAQTGTASGPTPHPNLQKLTDGKVPAYRLDLNDPAHFNAKAVAKALNTGGRPVIFMLHGIETTDKDAKQGFIQASQWYSQTYGNLPENRRPIIVGVDWDSGKVFAPAVAGGLLMGLPGAKLGGDYGYQQANVHAVETGKRFGELLENYNRFYPETHVNVVGHSLGNRMFMEAVRDNDVRVNSYLAVQGAVDRDQIRQGGRFADVLSTKEIGRMGATYTKYDGAMYAHDAAGYDDALGNNATVVKGRKLETYNLDADRQWGLNHFNYNDAPVRRVTTEFFGANGEAF